MQKPKTVNDVLAARKPLGDKLRKDLRTLFQERIAFTKTDGSQRGVIEAAIAMTLCEDSIARPECRKAALAKPGYKVEFVEEVVRNLNFLAHETETLAEIFGEANGLEPVEGDRCPHGFVMDNAACTKCFAEAERPTHLPCRCGVDVRKCTKGCELFACCGGYVGEGHMSDCPGARPETVGGRA